VQMGLGLLGRGVGDACAISKCNPTSFVITDLKSEKDLQSSLQALKEAGVEAEFVLGEHRENDFKNADVVLKSAGVPLDNKYINIAKENGAQVLMSTALATKYAQDLGMITIGITGSRGKSTTTQMIYEALKHKVGGSTSPRIFLGGNVRGVSTLELAQDFKKGDILVMELDSWQLQGFGDLQTSPHIAVFTNLLPDHLNYYPDMEVYFQDKANIFKYQKIENADLLVVSDIVYEKVLAENPPVPPFEASRIPKEWKLKVPGAHNRANAALALEVLSQMGLSMDEIKTELENFSGLEGRLDLLGDFDGIKIYNDNNATSPIATINAIDALVTEKSEEGRLIAIVGGADKQLDVSDLARKIEEKVGVLFLLSGSGTEKLKKELNKEFEEFESLEDVLRAAQSTARKGDTILFSPAFASFGKEFKNEYERNDKFKEIIAKLFDK